MFFKDWQSIYEKIKKDLNLAFDKDELATDVLSELLQNKELYSIKDLQDLFAGKDAVIFGAGSSLEKKIITQKNEFFGKILIAADGATSALLTNGILPDIIVTDLDGRITDQINANTGGSIAIIHAHGDNIDKIKEHVPHFKGKIIGTTQIDPELYDNIQNFGGFTDGDRAIFIAESFKAKNIFLVGFEYDGKIGKYSFSEKKDKQLKLKKLKWCEKLIESLKKEFKNIQEL